MLGRVLLAISLAAIPLSFIASASAGTQTAPATAIGSQELFDAVGVAPMTGGYENLVGAALTDDGTPVVFGGGNHASGNLGQTFPWAVSKQNGELVGLGFNDMTVRIGSEVFWYRSLFQKALSETVARALVIERTSEGRITALSMSVPAISQRGSAVSLSFSLAVKAASRVIVRREAFKRFDAVSAIRDALSCQRRTSSLFCGLIVGYLDGMRMLGLSLPGLELTESALTIDPSRDSFVTITDDKNTTRHALKAFTGALEKSAIDIIAAKAPEFVLHMQYDYIALFPADAKKCGDTGTVAYISGLLNREDGIVQKTLDKDFLRKFGSSAFTFNPKGIARAIRHIERYGRIKSVADIVNIKELNLTNGVEFQGMLHPVGPGVFYRRLVELSRADGCRLYGMLETQSLP